MRPKKKQRKTRAVVEPETESDSEPEPEPEPEVRTLIYSDDDQSDVDDIPCDAQELLEEPDADYETADEESDVFSYDEGVLYSLPTHDYVSRNQTVWSSEPPAIGRTRLCDLMKGKPGVEPSVRPRVSEPGDALKVFFTTEMKSLVVRFTNLEGNRRCANWKTLDLTEFDAFLGLLVLQGANNENTHSVHDIWSEFEGRPIYKAVMSRERFKDILISLRCDDPQTRTNRAKNDKLAAIRTFLNLWIPTIQNSYVPGEDLTVDEQLVPCKVRCAFKQYMPKKPRGKYGIKIWLLCDVNGYCLNFQVYTGRPANGERELNQGQRVVLDLVEPLGVASGRNIVFDNFVTSLPLVEALLERNLTSVGTIRKNKAELPAEFLAHKDRKVFSSLFGFQEKSTVVSYVPKLRKAVTLLSTLHHTADLEDEPGKKEADKQRKPEIILRYNKGKAGVDLLDQYISYNSVKRETRRWPMVIFFDLVDISLHNSWVVFKELSPGWYPKISNRRKLFLRQVGYSLILPHLRERRKILNLEIAMRNRIDKFLSVLGEEAIEAAAPETPLTPSRTRCKPCQRAGKKDKKTSTFCSKCEEPVCCSHYKPVCAGCFG